MKKFLNALVVTTQGAYLHKDGETAVARYTLWQYCATDPLFIFRLNKEARNDVV